MAAILMTAFSLGGMAVNWTKKSNLNIVFQKITLEYIFIFIAKYT